MWPVAEMDFLLVALLAMALPAMVAATPRRRRDFYDAEYEDYHPASTKTVLPSFFHLPVSRNTTQVLPEISDRFL